MHFHGVAWNDKLKAELAPELIKLLDYVKQRENKIWVGLFREIILYGQERDTAKLSVTKVAPKAITFLLTDRMADNWFSFPLTVKVRVPNDWTHLAATQAGKPIQAKLIEHEKNKYALIQAVPDRGEVVLTPARPAARRSRPKTRIKSSD